MRIKRLSTVGLIAALLIFTAPIQAQSPPADSTIRAAVYDLDKIAGELPRLTPDRTSNIKRLARTLDNAEAALERSTNKSDPSWTEAKARIADYRARLAALEAGGTAPSPAPATIAPQQAPTQAPTQAAPRLTSSGQARLNRLTQQAGQAERDLAALAPKALHEANERQRWSGLVARLRAEVEAFAEFKDMPEVQEVAARVEAAAARQQQLDQEATAQLAALGDIPATLRTIQSWFTPDKLPQPLEPPYEQARLEAWADGLRGTAQRMQQARQWLGATIAATDLYARDLGNTLNGTIGHTANNAVETAVTQTRAAARLPLQPLEGRIDFLLAIAPTDAHKIQNNLLQEGKVEEIFTEIDAAERAVADALAIEAALRLAPPADMAPWNEKLGRLRTHVAGLFEASVALVRMPAARGDDPKLAQIAEEVLKDPTYGAGPWRRLVVNGELRSQQEERGYASGNTITFYKYDWDQFQVTTAEEKNGVYFLWFNTLRFSRSGDTTTPLSRWYLANRFQGSRILEESIDK